MQCMRKSKIISLYDKVHFLAILIILLILTLKYWYFCFVLLIYLIFLYRKTSLFKIGVFLSLLVIFSSVRYYVEFESYEFYGTVIEITENKATVVSDFMKIIVYHDNELELGYYGLFKVTDLDYDSDLFNYSEYLGYKNIKDYYQLNEFTFINNKFVLGKINEFFVSGVDKLNISYSCYIKALVLADKSELEIYE